MTLEIEQNHAKYPDDLDQKPNSLTLTGHIGVNIDVTWNRLKKLFSKSSIDTEKIYEYQPNGYLQYLLCWVKKQAMRHIFPL